MFDNVYHLNITKKFINSENEFTHYTTIDTSLCGYSNSPCSETGDKRLSVKNKYGYKIYYIDK